MFHIPFVAYRTHIWSGAASANTINCQQEQIPAAMRCRPDAEYITYAMSAYFPELFFISGFYQRYRGWKIREISRKQQSDSTQIWKLPFWPLTFTLTKLSAFFFYCFKNDLSCWIFMTRICLTTQKFHITLIESHKKMFLGPLTKPWHFLAELGFGCPCFEQHKSHYS